MNPAERAIRPHDSVFLVVTSERLFGQGGLGHTLAVVRMDGFDPIGGSGVQALARAAPDGFVAGADVKKLGLICVRQPKYLADGLGQLAKTLFAALDRFVLEAQLLVFELEQHLSLASLLPLGRLPQ